MFGDTLLSWSVTKLCEFLSIASSPVVSLCTGVPLYSIFPWRFLRSMLLACPQLGYLGPILWCSGDDLLALMPTLQGIVVFPIFSFVKCGLRSCIVYFLVIFIMSPHERMMSKRGGLGKFWVKRTMHFSFDYLGTFFDIVFLEVGMDIILLDTMETDDRPYHPNFEL